MGAIDGVVNTAALWSLVGICSALVLIGFIANLGIIHNYEMEAAGLGKTKDCLFKRLKKYEKKDVLMGVISFIFPIAGFFMCIAWADKFYNRAVICKKAFNRKIFLDFCVGVLAVICYLIAIV